MTSAAQSSPVICDNLGHAFAASLANHDTRNAFRHRNVLSRRFAERHTCRVVYLACPLADLGIRLLTTALHRLAASGASEPFRLVRIGGGSAVEQIGEADGEARLG